MIPDLNQLRCFVAVGDELHFGRAAARLFMTQPPLSRQIRLLEEALGFRLFERNSRVVRLTTAGAAFLLEARRLLEMASAAVETAREIDAGRSGRVRIGFTAVAGYRLLPELIARARAELPAIETTLHEMVSVAQLDALRSGAIDVALMRAQGDVGADLSCRDAASEPLLLALHVNHPLTARDRIEPGDLGGERFIGYTAVEGKYFHDLIGAVLAGAAAPRVIHAMSQTHSVMALVRANLGVALVPASARDLCFPEVVFRPIWRDDVRAQLHLVWRESSPNPACRMFAAFAQAYLGQGQARRTEDTGSRSPESAAGRDTEGRNEVA